MERQMKPERLGEDAPRRRNDSSRRDGWYATFSMLDAGGAISASQLRAVTGTIGKLWRLTLGRLVGR